MTQIIRVDFKPDHAMHVDARWMHNRVMRAASRPATRTLFRAHDLQGTRLTIVTDDARFRTSDWRSIVEVLDVRPYAPQVMEGERRHFQVRLCPVSRSQGRTGRALRTQEELEGFVERLSARHGFEVLSYEATWERGYVIDPRAPALPSVTVEGELEVQDAAGFCQALLEGMGRAKSFGYGLLLSHVLD